MSELPVINHTQIFLVFLPDSLLQHSHYLLNKIIPDRKKKKVESLKNGFNL
jgi:hypothetical protein